MNKLKVKTITPANRPSFNEWSKLVNASRMYDETHVQEELRFDEYLRQVKRKNKTDADCYTSQPVNNYTPVETIINNIKNFFKNN